MFVDLGLGNAEVQVGQLSHPTSLGKLMVSIDASGLWSPPGIGFPGCLEGSTCRERRPEKVSGKPRREEGSSPGKVL